MTDFAKSFQSFDAVLMGRKTYEFALSHGMTAYPKMKNYVFSRTMGESPDKRVEMVAEKAGDFVRKLKNENGKDIWLCGGGSLAASLGAFAVYVNKMKRGASYHKMMILRCML